MPKTYSLTLQRYSDNKESTSGLLFFEEDFISYSLEDEFRSKKVRGDTRIPSGIYKLQIRKQVTPLTERYRRRYSWFQFHIEVVGVEEFNNIYLHIGNTDDDTDGCILLGDEINNNKIEDGFVSKSTPCFKRFYNLIYPLLERGDIVIFDIRDEKSIF